MEALKERVVELELMVASLVEAVDLLMKPKDEKKDEKKPSAPKSIDAEPASTLPQECVMCGCITCDPIGYVLTNIPSRHYDPHDGSIYWKLGPQRQYVCRSVHCVLRCKAVLKDEIKQIY